jgi:hypothetical protein
MPHPEPTQDELRTAWARCRRHDWPATFEEAMQDALLSRLVRINAMHPARGQRRPTAPTTPARDVTRERTPQRQKALELPGLPPGHFDRKRAAAGERQDD